MLRFAGPPQVAELVRQLYIEHAASFTCPDRQQVRGVVRSAVAGGLKPSLLGYGGFGYKAETAPVDRQASRRPLADADPASGTTVQDVGRQWG